MLTAEGRMPGAGRLSLVKLASLPEGVGRGCRIWTLLLFLLSALVVVVTGTVRAADPVSAAGTEPLSGIEKRDKSLTEFNKQVTNPLSNEWSLELKQSNYLLNSPDAWRTEFLFEPVLPVALTTDWNWVTRPVFKFFDSNPYINSAGNSAREAGLGDSTLTTVLSPNMSNWLLGLGPTLVLPTATTQHTGEGKWQAGPAAVFGYLGESFLLAVYPQQWWSLAGQSDRSATNKLQLQYFLHYFLGDGWSIGASPNILVNWEDSPGQKLTFPVGLGFSKVIKICGVPVKFGIEGQYMPIQPDSSGKKWNLQFSITPRIPKLIGGTLF